MRLRVPEPRFVTNARIRSLVHYNYESTVRDKTGRTLEGEGLNSWKIKRPKNLGTEKFCLCRLRLLNFSVKIPY